MKVLFDTDVILDFLLDREPFSTQMAYLLSKVERSEIIGLICASSVTTLYYLAAKAHDRKRASSYVKALLSLFEVAPVNRPVLESALSARFKDFEDAVVYESARHSNADFLVTRNVKDYRRSQIPVCTPAEFIATLRTIDKGGRE